MLVALMLLVSALVSAECVCVDLLGRRAAVAGAAAVAVLQRSSLASASTSHYLPSHATALRLSTDGKLEHVLSLVTLQALVHEVSRRVSWKRISRKRNGR